MALASLLFAPSRVDLTTFLTDSMDVKHLDGCKKEMKGTGEAVTGYLVMLGDMNEIRTKGSLGL